MKNTLKVIFLRFCFIFLFAAQALTTVEKGSVQITGILMHQNNEYSIGVNILSRSKFLFKIKNPESVESLDFQGGILLVDADFEIKKIIDSQNAEVIVKKLKKSAAKSAPQYSHIGPK